MPEQTTLDCGHCATQCATHLGKTYCPTCDAQWIDGYMQTAYRTTLYLIERDSCLYLTNWFSTLEIKIDHWKYGRHNMVDRVTHVWFKHADMVWYGVNYGGNTQLCHCKKTKS